MKEDQRVALTKRLLQEGLLRLLEEKELEKVRVSELCSQSGINRATFYRHYGQPRDILGDLRQEIIRDVKEITEKADPEADLYKWLVSICRYFREKSHLLCLLFKTRTDDEFAQIIRQLYSQQARRYQKTHGTDMDEDSMKLMAYYYAGGFYYILRQWITEPVDKSAEEVADVMYGFLRRQ